MRQSAGAANERKRSATISGRNSSRSRSSLLSSDHILYSEKAGPGQRTRAFWSGLKAGVIEAYQAAAIPICASQSRARDLIYSREKCLGDYFFFFLPAFFAFFAFFAFLAMLPSSPKVGSMQVEHRRAHDSVHHNRKIDTACFEQGKRRAPLRVFEMR
jgi:hypothetical protein